MKKWIEEYIELEKAKDIKMKKMLSDTEYIKWLDRFTLKHSGFDDSEWLYFPNKISKKDMEHIKDLYLMYSIIEKYSNENYIYPLECKFGNFYKIRFNDIGFEIGVLVGQGTVFFCNRVEIDNEKDFIDFNDIINNKTSENTLLIKKKLNELSNLVVSMYESGVPLEAITIALDDTLTKIEEQNNLNKVKKLKKD